MKVLLVGVGTVGEAIARLSAGRPWLERMVLADHDLDRARRIAGEIGDDSSHPAALIDASDERAVEELARAHDVDLVMNAVDPRFVMPVFRARSPPTPTTWTWRSARPRRIRPTRTGPSGASSATSSSRWTPSGVNAAGSPWSGRGSAPAWPRCSPPTPPSTSSTRSTTSTSAPAVTCGSRVTRSRRCSRSGRPSRSASIRRWCGRRSVATSPCRRSRSRSASSSPRGSARWSASTSSTRTWP